MDYNDSLDFQIELVKEIVDKTDFSLEFQLAIYDQVNRDLRTEKISNGRNNGGPTKKQIEYAEKLGIDEPGQYTKAELSKKINDIVKGGF